MAHKRKRAKRLSLAVLAKGPVPNTLSDPLAKGSSIHVSTDRVPSRYKMPAPALRQRRVLVPATHTEGEPTRQRGSNFFFFFFLGSSVRGIWLICEISMWLAFFFFFSPTLKFSLSPLPLTRQRAIMC